ncbi:MAG: hypothetical protein L0154_12230 [Chloroflexi bacterium]|nr:hypothetical protein [Chloroflexota bacterium]
MNENEIRDLTRRVVYPPTPDITIIPTRPRSTVRQLAPIAIIVFLLLLGLLVVEPVRAAIVDILRIGGIEIHVGETDLSQATPTFVLVGETTLKEAQAAVNFTLKYPEALGLPDVVYQQDKLVVMRWHEPDIALYQFNGEGFYKETPNIEWTEVDGSTIAAWIATPHLLWFDSGDEQEQQQVYLVEGNVLIWEEPFKTYRLETRLSREETIALAESLVEVK